MTNTKRKEAWKTYPEYPWIEVSNLGRVKTKDRYVPGKNGSKRLIKGRILKQHDIGCGYMQVHFGMNGKQVALLVHRIVAITFITNPNNYPEVNHIDNNPKNNAVSNLEWCSREQNIVYKEQLGISAKEATRVLRKPVIAVNLETSEVFCIKSQSEAARKLDVHQSSISEVVKGKLNKTGGYWFCNADENVVEKAKAKFGDDIARKVQELIGENYD